MTITYSFSGNGNTTYPIGSLVDWHSSALIEDQIQVLLNDVEQVNGVGYTINEGEKALVLSSAASGSDTITLNRVTPNTFFSTLETVGAASASSTLSNDQQLMNRIQEVEGDIVVASANTTIQDENGNLFGILKGDGIGLSFNAGDGSLTLSSSGGGSGGGGSVTLDFSEGVGPSTGTSFTLSSANTGFATTVVSDDLQAQIDAINTNPNNYVQTAGFGSLFTTEFNSAISTYGVKAISSPLGTLSITENGTGNWELEAAGGASVSSLQGQSGALLMDMRNDQDDAGVTSRIGLDGCTHSPSSPTFNGVTTGGTAQTVEGWSWVHDLGAGAFVSHKPLSGTRDSELIGDKTLTVSGTLAGDANDDIKTSSNVLVAADAPAKPGHLMSMDAFTARTADFSLGNIYSQTRDIDNRINYVYPLSDIDADPIASATADSKYIYPEDLQSSEDYTGYCAPGEGDQPQNGGSYGLYVPGSAFRTLESDTDSSRVPGSLAGSIAAYRTDRGISEATPGSGNVFGIEGVRLLNAKTFSDTTNAVAGRAGYVNPIGDGTLIDTTSSTERAAMRFSFAGFDKAASVLYIPGSETGGLVRVSMRFTSSYTGGNLFHTLMMYTGMDEANESFGSADSIVPVAYNRFLNRDPIVSTVTYTYDNSDGAPRYFSTAVMREHNRSTTTRAVDWTVSRASVPDVGNYHDVDTSDPTGYSWSRGTYDKYIQKLVNDNFVAQ